MIATRISSGFSSSFLLDWHYDCNLIQQFGDSPAMFG